MSAHPPVSHSVYHAQTKSHDFLNEFIKARTISTSSSSSDSSTKSASSTQETSNDNIGEESSPSEFYEIVVGSDMIFWTENDGDEDMCELSEWKQIIAGPVKAKQITLECSVFGQEVEYLMPTTSKERPELQKDFREIQRQVGLPFDWNGNPIRSAALGEHMRCVTFGCKDFPSGFMGRTLKAWRDHPENLESISISWRTPLEDREEAVNQMAKDGQFPVTHVWKFSKHDESMFALAYFDEEERNQKAGQDSVNMYLIHANHNDHMAVLSISDYALTVHCAFSRGRDATPILKRAFNNATQIKDTFYQIMNDRINKDVVT